MSCIFSVYCNMDDRTDFFTFTVFHIQIFHKFGITCRYRNTVNLCSHTFTAQFFNLCHTVTVDLFAICFLKALTDRMNSTHLEYALRHGSCLIEYHIFCLCHRLQIVRSFYQNTFMTCSADSCKEAERDTDHQCTRAADNQECQCSVDPVAPFRRKRKRKHSDQWR